MGKERYWSLWLGRKQGKHKQPKMRKKR